MSKRKSKPSSQPAQHASQTLSLPADCLIANASTLRESLLGLVQGPAVTLDASGVQRIDTVGLQLIAAFVRDRRASQAQVTWLGVPAVLVERARLLGLLPVLAFENALVDMP